MLSRFSIRELCRPTFLPIRRHKTNFFIPEVHDCKIIHEEGEAEPDYTGPVTELHNAPAPLPLPYDGPQRDLVNFPRITLKDKPSPTRLFCIPEEWFQFLKPKLGVSGPYTLMIGFYYFLVSKEFYVIGTHEHEHMVAFIMLMYFFGKSDIKEFLKRIFREEPNARAEVLQKFEKANLELREEAIEHEKKEQWRQLGKQLLFDAKKENVGLQLEAAYRHNAMEVYKQVKRRLDYQVEVSKIDERIKRRFMVDWVIDRVKESIMKTSEKDTLKQCISDLNILAAKA